MKKTKTFSVEDKIFNQFELICENSSLNKSKVIQSMIEEFIKEESEDLSALKVTEINNITSEIYKEMVDVAKTNEKIKELLNAKYTLVVEENKDKIVYKVQLSVLPKLELDKNMTYISKLDTEFEEIKILENDHKFVTLNNGNKIRVEDFFRHYERAYYLDPINFLYGNGVIEEVEPVNPDILKQPSLDPEKVKNIINNIVFDEKKLVKVNRNADKPYHSESFEEFYKRVNDEHKNEKYMNKEFAEKIFYTYNLKDEPSIIKEFASVKVKKIVEEESGENKARTDFWSEIKN